jgi:hypothetical protein
MLVSQERCSEKARIHNKRERQAPVRLTATACLCYSSAGSKRIFTKHRSSWRPSAGKNLRKTRLGRPIRKPWSVSSAYSQTRSDHLAFTFNPCVSIVHHAFHDDTWLHLYSVHICTLGLSYRLASRSILFHSSTAHPKKKMPV